MLKALISTLHSAVEIAFLLAFLSAYLRGNGQQRLVSCLKWGAVSGLAVTIALTYSVLAVWERETVELIINVVATLVILGIVAWIGLSKQTANDSSVGKFRQILPVIILLVSIILVILPGLDIGLTQTRIFQSLDRPTSTEVASRLGALLLVLLLPALTGIAIHKVAIQNLGLIKPVILIALLVILLRDATTVSQVMLVKGMLPLTDWLFRVMVILVNNNVIFFYLLIATAAVLVSIAFWRWRRQKYSFDGLHPAQKRKLKITVLRTAKLFVTSGLLLLLVILGEGTGTVFTNRPPQLSPATPVSAENGRVRIHAEALADGNLHRFSFTTGDNVPVRFLAIHKGSGVYGVGLDACSFCGVTGYHQDGDNVICNKCNAAINKNTIGFQGGCNPIPLGYEKAGDSVEIAVDKLGAAKWIFAR